MSALLASLKTQVEELEVKIQECYQLLGNQEFAGVEPVIDEPDVEETVVVEVVVEDEVVVEIADADGEAIEDQTVDIFEMEVMDIELEPSDDLPFYDDVPSENLAPEEAPVDEIVEDLPEDLPEDVTPAPVAVIDAMTAKQAWRTDMPGSPVKDIRSAISLNDRILFINYLFGEDPMAFQEMLTQLNAMSSFNDAVNAVIAAHPEWDLESDTVYRFMMALRRRLQ